jgi:hypothetical protein
MTIRLPVVATSACNVQGRVRASGDGGSSLAYPLAYLGAIVNMAGAGAPPSSPCILGRLTACPAGRLAGGTKRLEDRLGI